MKRTYENMNRFYYLNILLTILLRSCEKEANNIKVPHVETKLVVQSYISPQDTLLTVFVSESKPVLGKKYHGESRYVKNADVILSDGENSIKLEFGGITFNDSAYLADPRHFPILPGKTYYLSVSTQDGKKAEAFCKVPENIPIVDNFRYDSSSRNDMGWDAKYYVVSFDINDVPGEQNFYRLFAEYQRVYYSEYLGEFITNFGQVYFGSKDMIEDSNRDGALIRISSELNAYIPKDSYLSLPLTFRLRLLSTDVHYFKYHKTLKESHGDNPFQEPALIYSNMDGGLGVFAAFNSATIEHVFR